MLVELKNIFYRYEENEQYILNDLNMNIEKSEFLGIIGKAGAGKSTLLRLLANLDKQDAGQIIKDKGSTVGIVFQYPERQLFEDTVIKDVEFGPTNRGFSKLDIELKSFEALKKVGIHESLLDVSPFTLSGGQKRLVAIAGILAMDTDIIILDEPTAGLDVQASRRVLDIFKKLQIEEKKTIVMVSHDMDLMAEYTDRLAVMDKGRVVLQGDTVKVFQYEQELKSIDCGVPQTVHFLNRLKEHGINIDNIPVKYDEGIRKIVSCIKEIV